MQAVDRRLRVGESGFGLVGDPGYSPRWVCPEPKRQNRFRRSGNARKEKKEKKPKRAKRAKELDFDLNCSVFELNTFRIDGLSFSS